MFPLTDFLFRQREILSFLQFGFVNFLNLFDTCIVWYYWYSTLFVMPYFDLLFDKSMVLTVELTVGPEDLLPLHAHQSFIVGT